MIKPILREKYNTWIIKFENPVALGGAKGRAAFDIFSCKSSGVHLSYQGNRRLGRGGWGQNAIQRLEFAQRVFNLWGRTELGVLFHE